MKEEVTLAGKTVEGVSYFDPWFEGFTILFTDGSKLNICERMQVGEITVTYNGQELAYSRELRDE
jgi:hypothetical protein